MINLRFEETGIENFKEKTRRAERRNENGWLPELGTEEVVDDAVRNILKEMGSELDDPELVGLVEDNGEFGCLSDFVNEFWDKAVDLIVNVISTEN